MSDEKHPRLVLKQDWLAVPVNNIPAGVAEFEKIATLFKKGTVFEDFGKPPHDDSDPAPQYGWMYHAEGEQIKFAHLFSYVLNHWIDNPHLFEEFIEEDTYTGFRVPADWGKKL
jgi:hypothetical protein